MASCCPNFQWWLWLWWHPNKRETLRGIKTLIRLKAILSKLSQTDNRWKWSFLDCCLFSLFFFFMLTHQYHMVLDFLLWFLLLYINTFFDIANIKGCINNFHLQKLENLSPFGLNLKQYKKKLWHCFLQNQFLALVCSCTHILQKVLSFYNAIT